MISSGKDGGRHSVTDRSMLMRVFCLLVVCLTLFIAVHSHHDGDLDCALHCPSCAGLHASAPGATVSAAVVLSFVVTGTVTHPESRVPVTLITTHLYVRPPPAA
jgi:fumarate reductase subunit D